MSSRCPSSVVSLSHDVEVSKNSRQGGGNMRQLVTCVKRLYRDKKQLKAQVGAHFRSGVCCLQSNLRQRTSCEAHNLLITD